MVWVNKRLSLILALCAIGGETQAYVSRQISKSRIITPYAFGANVGATWQSLGMVSSTEARTTTSASAITSTTRDPEWGTNYGVYTKALVNVNNLPTSSMLGGGAGGTPQALAGAIDIPSTDTGSFVEAAIAGHARTSAPAPNGSAVGLFGGAMVNAANTWAWGLNTICTNTAKEISGTKTGFNNVSCYAAELDVNFRKLPDGSNPVGQGIGLQISGGAEVVPTRGAYGIVLTPFGSPAAGGAYLPWTVGIQINGQPSGYALLIGTNSYINTANSPSQLIGFQGSDGTATIRTGVVGADPAGNMFVQPSSTGQVIYLRDGSGNNTFSTSPFGATTYVPAVFNSTITLKTYTIATLPHCSSSLLGSIAIVSNGASYGAGVYGDALTATGAVTRQVLCTNTAGPTAYAWAYN